MIARLRRACGVPTRKQTNRPRSLRRDRVYLAGLFDGGYTQSSEGVTTVASSGIVATTGPGPLRHGGGAGTGGQRMVPVGQQGPDSGH
jgi:hypothetical protein